MNFCGYVEPKSLYDTWRSIGYGEIILPPMITSNLSRKDNILIEKRVKEKQTKTKRSHCDFPVFQLC